MILCPWLNNYVVVETDGYTRPCCIAVNDSTRIANIKDGIKNAFNDSKLAQLRNELEANDFSPFTSKYCNKCKLVEETGNRSVRQITSFISNKVEIKAIQFKMSNQCQLVCAHCNPILSSSWAKFEGIKPSINGNFKLTTEFLEELEELLPQLELIKFTGGEPFLNQEHWKLLEYFQNNPNIKNCKLEYITNGLITPKYNLWNGWKSVTVSVSVDGYGPYYEWFRRKAKWDNLVNKINDLYNATDLYIIYSMTPYTISSYKKTKEFFNNIPIYATAVVNPPYASLKNFPKALLEEYHDVPYSTFTSENEDLNMYIQWAKNWDIRWNTIGQAETLFPWMSL